MWSACHPKSENELSECAQLGKSLSRLTQPTILIVLARANEALHGYKIIQEISASPMFGGSSPDPTGIYRILKQMENNKYIKGSWDNAESGSQPKKCYEITKQGKDCLRRWIDALGCYSESIKELRILASDSLDIDLPPLPHCVH
ncbi:MAG: PadR family transcriptional regulator [Coriobacteriales bacterium]|nr:PadR family transcriptional regulator [Coriobacteriales bacterium]